MGSNTQEILSGPQTLSLGLTGAARLNFTLLWTPGSALVSLLRCSPGLLAPSHSQVRSPGIACARSGVREGASSPGASCRDLRGVEA